MSEVIDNGFDSAIAIKPIEAEVLARSYDENKGPLSAKNMVIQSNGQKSTAEEYGTQMIFPFQGSNALSVVSQQDIKS